MKVSWGNKILIVYVAFGMFILFMVYKAVNTRYDLVSKDYYKEELRYQDRIDRLNNAAKLSNVLVQQNTDAILIHLPKEQKGFKLVGDVFFYCITDERKDFHTSLEVDSTASQTILKKYVQKGAYKIKLTWQLANDPYYFEDKLIIK